MAKKGALDFASARAGCLRDDQQPGSGIGGKLAAAPDCASGEFGLGVGGGMELNFFRWFALGGLAPLAPGIEEAALDGQNAVETGQQQRRALGRV